MVSAVFKSLNERQVGACVEQVKKLAGGITSEDFDFETASNLLAVMSRLRNTEIQLPDSDAWVSKIAHRFCVSKPSTDLLCMSVQGDEPYCEAIRAGHTHITVLAQKAMAHSLQGDHSDAVTSLMERGKETLNAKLVELAGMVLNRHATNITGSDGMAVLVDELRRKFCSKGTQVALGGGSGRAAGALSIGT